MPQKSNHVSDEWFVAVRYGDGQKECVRCKQVKHFYPNSLTDFDPTRILKIKTNSWSQDGAIFENYKGIVEGLGVTKEGAEASRRAFIKNQTQAQKDKTKYILSTISTYPQDTTDHPEPDPDCAEQADANRTAAKRNATAEFGERMLSNIQDCVPRTQRDSARKIKEKPNTSSSAPNNKKNRGHKRKLKDTHPLVLAQGKKISLRTSEKENAAHSWGTSLAVDQEGLQTVGLLENISAPSAPKVTSQLSAPQVPHSTEPGTSASSCSQVNPGISKNTGDCSKASTPSGLGPLLNSTTTPTPTSSKANSVNGNKAITSISSSESKLQRKKGKCCCNQLSAEIAQMKEAFTQELKGVNEKLALLLEAKVKAADADGPSAGPGVMEVCYGKVVTAGRVHLGSNFTCAKDAWRTMNCCTKMYEWCIAVLCGTFTAQVAMRYRVNPRYDDLCYFPPDFVATVRGHCEDFMKRRTKELEQKMKEGPLSETDAADLKFFKDDRNKYLDQLGAHLSDRAHGLFKQHRNQLRNSGVELPPRSRRPAGKKRQASTTPKAPTKKLLTQPSCSRKKKITTALNCGADPGLRPLRNQVVEDSNQANMQQSAAELPPQPSCPGISETLPTHELPQTTPRSAAELQQLPSCSGNSKTLPTHEPTHPSRVNHSVNFNSSSDSDSSDSDSLSGDSDDSASSHRSMDDSRGGGRSPSPFPIRSSPPLGVPLQDPSTLQGLPSANFVSTGPLNESFSLDETGDDRTLTTLTLAQL